MAVAAGALPATIADEEIRRQYNLLKDRAVELTPAYVKKDKKRKLKEVEYDQTALYSRILSKQNLREGIPDALHLTLTGMTRTSCEAVVEGMGSVLKKKNTQRGSLAVDNLEWETMIRWQGPNPSSNNATILIKNSLDRHFKKRGDWHFVTSVPRVKYSVSEVVDRIRKLPDKIPFDKTTSK